MHTAQILENYKKLLSDIDEKTNQVYGSSADFPCKNRCFDCCKQLFPVSFAEAYYISSGFFKMPRALRRARQAAAEKITGKIRAANLLQFEKKGVDEKTARDAQAQFAQFLHGIKSDCPALDPGNPAGACTVYEFRNHDCRTMGASFDLDSREVVGCFRFANLKHLLPNLMNFNYRYEDKMKMDAELIEAVTGATFTQNLFYFTTMCGPLLKNYAETDWKEFFRSKNVPQEKTQQYWVVIDV